MSEQNCHFAVDNPIGADGEYVCVLPYGHEEGHVLAEYGEAHRRWIPKDSYYVFGFKKETLDVEL